MELGFTKTAELEKVGIGYAASFTWGIERVHVEKYVSLYADTRKIIRDEYDREYTWKEFLDDLVMVPPEFQFIYIGEEWS